jgi:hypothetical protein
MLTVTRSGLILCVFALAGCGGSGKITPPRKVEPPIGLAKGQRAPDIDGLDAGGKRLRLSDYRGKVVVLDFWASW